MYGTGEEKKKKRDGEKMNGVIKKDTLSRPAAFAAILAKANNNEYTEFESVSV